MIKHWFKTSLALTIAAVSVQANANGLAINEQSASSMGTAFAGRSSSAMDASTVFGNPAGMSKLHRAEVSGGLAILDASTDIRNPEGAAPGTNRGDMVPFAAIPFAYWVTPINERWHAGLGVYVPFGVISDYERSFQGRYHGLESEVRVITIQPTISYRVNDRVSLGFGPTINRIDGTLTRAAPMPVGGDANIDIRGDDIGYGFNAGIMVDVTDQVTWGLTYFSKVDYTLEGRTRLSGFTPLPGLDGRYSGTLDFTSPESVDVSLTYKMDNPWTLYAGAVWTRWSRLQEIVVDNRGLAAPYEARFGTLREEQNWSDDWAFAFGAAYQLTPEIALRTGLAFDRSPTTDADRTVRIPVGNRKIWTAGLGWNISDDLTLDVAYAYLREDTAEVTEPDYRAEYRNSAHGLATQVTWRY